MVNVSSDSIRCFLCFHCANTLRYMRTTIAANAEAVWFKTLSDKHNTFGVISNDFRLVLFIHGSQISSENGARIINITMFAPCRNCDRMLKICHHVKCKLLSRHSARCCCVRRRKRNSIFLDDFRRLSDPKWRSFKTRFDVVPKIIRESRNRDSLKIIFKYLMKM